ncbi:MAG: hypothetical protein EU547_04160 [Promethearchaeota archaeon]|nr:MAG: hypothetical protein EU547_04160 [Candidatus Lokiarchaeota archaeon]
MINLKKYSWLLILIGGILVLLGAILPSSIFIDAEDPTNFGLIWIFGAMLDETGIDIVEGSKMIIVGGIIGTIVLIILALVLIISSILTVTTEIEFPFKEYIWLLLGILLFIYPFIYKTSISLIANDLEDVITLFMGSIELFTVLLSFGGLFSIVAGLEELRR